MKRRDLLRTGAATVPVLLAGCGDDTRNAVGTGAGTPAGTDTPAGTGAASPAGGWTDTPTGTASPTDEPTAAGTEPPTDTPTADPTPTVPPADRVVSVVEAGPQPDLPVRYGVEAVAPAAAGEEPPRLRVTVTNTGDREVVLGERRQVLFLHTSGGPGGLFLYEAPDYFAADDCWRLVGSPAHLDYYRRVRLAPGEQRRAETFVYADVPEGRCLPLGTHRVGTTVEMRTGATPSESGPTRVDWGVTLRVEEG